MEDYEDAGDFLDNGEEEESNYNPSDEEYNILDEPVEGVDPQPNMEYELDSSNVEVDLVIGKTCNL